MSVFSNSRAVAPWLRRQPTLDRIRPLGRALVPAAVVAAAALPLGTLVPRVGAPIFALMLGMAIGIARPMAGLRSGLGTLSRDALQIAIVLLGATISLSQVASVGVASLPVMLGSLAAAAVLGRRLGVPRRLRVLVGVGTGICGASAIAAVSGVIEAEAREIRYAISTIFVFNLAAVLLFPTVGHLLGMGPHAFGLWSGTAVNDTSSVLAAGFAYSHAAGTYALIVKLTRTTMIIPITIFLATVMVRRGRHDGGRSGGAADAARGRIRRVVPWFLLWFVVASAADSLGLISADSRAALSHIGLALTTLALGAVGLSTDLRELRHAGVRPLMLGALVWGAVAITSLSLQAATGTL